MNISISSVSLEIPAGRGRLSSEQGRPDSLGPESKQSTPGQATESPGPQTWQEPVDFIAIVALVQEHDVHQLELEPSTGTDPQAWQQKNMYNSFNLGEGASSFLELHTMRQNVDLLSRSLRKGDRVALKRSFLNRFDDDVGVTPEQYDFIKRELRVFCHQRLHSHENICKLLFVGWEEYTPAPVLGLELAEYGTLKDLLFDANLRDHGSLATHLVLDIALGLAALHDVEIVHGDVKTGNILVFAHPQRKVVAKLSDFSDSISLADNGKEWASIGGTHAWRAPECYRTAEYDLKKTDVYSFGLCALAILAQGIWYSSANNTGLGDCFLLRIKELDGKPKNEIQAQITSWKQDADNLVLIWGLEWADAFANEDDMAKTNARFVVSACLWREPEKRKSMDTVIWGQFEVLSSAGERQRMDEFIASRNTRDDEPNIGIAERRRRSSHFRMSSIGNENMPDMHAFFKSRMLRALEKIASPALDLDFEDVEDVLREPTKLNYADILSAVAQGSKPIIPAGIDGRTALRALEAATQVAECYSIGFGTPRNFSIARKWLTVSARSGRLDHAIYFSAVDDALGHSELDRPEIALRLLWLLLTASGGCTETSKVLRERHPNFHAIAERIRRQSGGILRRAGNPEAIVSRIADRLDNEDLPIDHPFPPIGYAILHFAVALGHEDGVKAILDEGANVNVVDFTGFSPLQLAASCGNANLVDILLHHGADPCSGSDISRFTPLHFLSFVEDELVDSIAEAMVRNAEQLSVISERGSVELENPFQSLKGSPLQWAARKLNERLFKRLLNLHLTFSATLVDLDEVLEYLACMHQPSMLGVLISLVPNLRHNRRPLDLSELDKLLLCCLTDVAGIGNIMVHRAHYEKAKLDTLEVLLKAGADPFRLSTTQFNSPSNVLQRIVVGDDLDILNRLVSFGEDRQLNLRAVFEDTRHFGGRNAFQRAIYCASWRVFQYLTQSPYIDLGYRSESGMTALHAAATNNDPRFIDVLLRLGCDPYSRADDGQVPFQSAIFFKAFKSASRLLQPDACTKERLFAATIEACHPTGYTLFGSVLAASLTNYRQIVNFTSIRFLESVGAFTFVNSVLAGTTLLDIIAKQYPTIRPDYEAFDRALLEYILSRAPLGVLNEHDYYGLTPLHWMVLRGNLSAITTVLTHPSSQGQLDINIETIEARPTPVDPRIAETGSVPGNTALNFALRNRHRIPHFIKQGGQREMRQWCLRTEAIIEVLQEAGGSVGSKSTGTEELEAEGEHVVHTGDDILSSLLVPLLGQRFRAETSSHSGTWPLRLQGS